ncbi:MAG: DUF1801 domain-containing protein [Candidatus Levyibacteriota bacterium]
MNPSQLIDKQIAATGGWRGELMTKLRKLIHEADPEITEDWKWEVGVYVHNGMVCAVSAFKDHVKINFFKGAQLKDPDKLINAGLESKKNRAIDFSEGKEIKEDLIKKLIQEAVSLNK